MKSTGLRVSKVHDTCTCVKVEVWPAREKGEGVRCLGEALNGRREGNECSEVARMTG